MKINKAKIMLGYKIMFGISLCTSSFMVGAAYYWKNISNNEENKK